MSLNPQQEKVIQIYLDDTDGQVSKTDAYKAAGYGGKSSDKTLNENASRFFSDSKVVARIGQLRAEIQDKVLDKIVIDRTYITQGILDTIDKADKDGDRSNTLKGLDMLGKMYDLNEDKQNDRLMSSKNKGALIENYRKRMLDVTPEEKK